MKMITIEIVGEVEVSDGKALRAGIWTSESGKVYSEISLGLCNTLSPMPRDPHICLPLDEVPKLVELLAVLRSHQRDEQGNDAHSYRTSLS